MSDFISERTFGVLMVTLRRRELAPSGLRPGMLFNILGASHRKELPTGKNF